MRILVTNDDGINSKGIIALAEMASKLGEVYVVAPEGECSAMAHHISVRNVLLAKKHDFPIPVKKAVSISGTPADCVKIALAHLLDFKPDYVFSGINNGYNAGCDILYSGTVGAAMEGLAGGVKAMAFSNKANSSYDILDRYLLDVTKQAIERDIPAGHILNINFPGGSLDDYKGTLWDRKIAPFQYFKDIYDIKETEEGTQFLAGGIVTKESIELDDTDMGAVMNGYISIGLIRCNVF